MLYLKREDVLRPEPHEFHNRAVGAILQGGLTMKRLTMKDENGCFLTGKTATVTWNSLINENRYRGKAVDRLAAYEDTGLEPEEIIELKARMEGLEK